MTGSAASNLEAGSSAIIRRAVLALSEASAAAESDSRAAVYVLPAPRAPLDALLTHFEHEEAVLWAPCRGVEVAAIGAAHVLEVTGSERFGSLRRDADELWGRLSVVNLSGTSAPQPRLFGGFAFRAGGAQRAPWTTFGDGRFVLPRLTYIRRNDEAFLSVAVPPARSEARARHAIDEARQALEWLDRAARAASERTAPHTRIVETCERSGYDWAERVAHIRREIAEQRLEKVVLARRVLLTLDPPPDPLQVLERLRDEAPHATRFAFRRANVTFLGATPERLLAKSGLRVETEALAGSQRADGRGRHLELLQSRKDLAEHAIVVREIVRALAPLCASLHCPERPVVRELRHVVHLLTPIEGELREREHVLHLVEKLHPTPAVGGVPRPDALAWLAEHEPDERGWYAGPIGWFDAAGDGEFAVALRSGLIDGPRAHLYVGAGIVAESEPEGEYQETALKLRTLLVALGAGG